MNELLLHVTHSIEDSSTDYCNRRSGVFYFCSISIIHFHAHCYLFVFCIEYFLVSRFVLTICSLLSAYRCVYSHIYVTYKSVLFVLGIGFMVLDITCESSLSHSTFVLLLDVVRALIFLMRTLSVVLWWSTLYGFSSTFCGATL